MSLTKIDDRGLKTPIDLQDDEKIRLGTGNDLQIYHGSSGGGSSYLDTTGSLQIHTSQLFINNEANTERMIRCVQDGAVELYHNGVNKFETGTSVNVNSNHFEITSGQQLRFDNSNNNRTSEILNTGSSGNSTISFKTNGGDRMLINESGNVGIGTASPEKKLHVKNGSSGSSYSADGADLLIIENSDSVGIDLRSPAANSGNIFFSDANARSQGRVFYDHNSDAMSFCTNGVGNERIRINSSGNVGIGTTTPDQKLHVLKGSAGSIDSTPNSVLTLENSTDAILQFLSPSNKVNQIRFGDPADNGAGYIDYDHNTNRLAFGVAGPERMRINSSGNVGIGVSSPSFKLDVAGKIRVDAFVGRSNISAPTADASMYRAADNTLAFATGSTERMRVDSDGGLRINSTGAVIADELLSVSEDGTAHELCGFRINSQSHNKDMITMAHVANSGDRMFIRFKRTGSLSNVGSINTNPTATAFNTSSDYRLKENEVLISDGITRLKQLKPYRFNFKIEPDRTVDGFFAHEVLPVVAEAVTGEKDAVDEKGNIEPQGLDYAKITPLLTAALQEEISKREALETRVAALEAG